MAFFCPQCNLTFDTFATCSTHIETSSSFQCSKWRFHPELEDRCQKSPTKNAAVARLHSAIKKRVMPPTPAPRQEGDVVLDTDGQPLVNAQAGMNIRGVLSQKPTSAHKEGINVSKVNDDLFLSFGAGSLTARNVVSSPSSAAAAAAAGKSSTKRKRNDVDIQFSDSASEAESDSDSDSDSDSGNAQPRRQPKSPLLRLHNEILNFVECIQPTKIETQNRMRVVAEIEQVARELFLNQTFEVQIFGSTLTGLALPTSDVDIVIMGLPYNQRKCIIKLGKLLVGGWWLVVGCSVKHFVPAAHMEFSFSFFLPCCPR